MMIMLMMLACVVPCWSRSTYWRSSLFTLRHARSTLQQPRQSLR